MSYLDDLCLKSRDSVHIKKNTSSSWYMVAKVAEIFG